MHPSQGPLAHMTWRDHGSRFGQKNLFAILPIREPRVQVDEVVRVEPPAAIDLVQGCRNQVPRVS